MSLDVLVTAFRRQIGTSLVLPIHAGEDLAPDLGLTATKVDVAGPVPAHQNWHSNPSDITLPGGSLTEFDSADLT